MPDPTNVKRSKLLMPANCKGVMEALHPNTKKILNRLLPMTLPMAISGFFFKAATMEVASSGREVPPATSVSPITDSLTPRLRAMLLAPSTNHCPPKISQNKKYGFPHRETFDFFFRWLGVVRITRSYGKCVAQKDREEAEQNQSV